MYFLQKPKNYLELCVYSKVIYHLSLHYVLIIYVTFWFCKPKSVYFPNEIIDYSSLWTWLTSKAARNVDDNPVIQRQIERAERAEPIMYRGFQSFALLVCSEVKRLTTFRSWNLNQFHIVLHALCFISNVYKQWFLGLV